MPGKGSFAANRTEMDEKRKRELLRQLDAIAEELRYLGVTAEEIAARFGGGKEET